MLLRRTGNAFRLLLLALVLCGRQSCPAAEPPSLADALQERSALGRALTTRFLPLEDEAAAHGSHLVLNLAVALLIAAGLAALKSSPRLQQQFPSPNSKPASPADLASNLLEEPSVVAFFDALKAGPSAPSACAPATAHPLREFSETAPGHLADLRKLFSELGRAPGEAARQAKLLEAVQRISTLREQAGRLKLVPAWQVAFALEELLKQLQRKPTDLTPSVLRTTAGALDLLRDLCHRRVRPDLATEPPVRLLAVDDDLICRRAMSFSLMKAFPKPDLAPDGEAALALAIQHPYDAIFLDVEMPGMTGFDLCSRIHKTELNRTTPVVFVTGHADLESRTQATLLGAQDFIAKPFLMFEITLKVLTMVLRARLDPAAAKPAPAATPEITSAARAVPAPAGAAGDEDRLASPASAHLEVAAPDARSTTSLPARPELVEAFFTRAPAQLEALRQHLAAAGNVKPDGLKDLLGDLYLDTHKLCSDTRRAELSAALRLTSALEAMLNKLFDHPKLGTPSTLDAAAGALDVLDELCRARTDPDLAQPAARILVVDDDPVACRAIAMSLQLAFGRPDSAASGEAAVALAGKRGYDLIFLDVSMPGMDGFAACAQIHGTVLNNNTPVVFVTGADDTASRAQAASCGGCGFIPKPVLASQITLVALSYLLHSRLGRPIPVLGALPSPTGSSPEPIAPSLAEGKHPQWAGSVGRPN